ncbi:MAG: DNA topoisomerase I, partial [Chlorobi bacterium]|nr:DNA topoisomerase I [Chlorobiota bacterium]
PARYNEATLVKKLEELGIGRPSTYAPTIQIIQKRGYVEKKNIPSRKRSILEFEWTGGKPERRTRQETYGGEKKKLIPTDVGMVVNEFLTRNFDNIVDYNFTAQVEDQFDKIARGQYDWVKMLDEFYREFAPQVDRVIKEARTEKGERFLGTDPETGEKVFAKIGPYGPMVQLGEAAKGKKPKYASLLPGMSITDISLEDALELFRLPKKIGEHEGKEVVVGAGKYGPYIRYGNKFISIPAHLNPLRLEWDDALALIRQKENEEKPLAYVEDKPVFVQRGKYGPYLKWGEMNIPVPKGTSPYGLEEEEIKTMIARQREKLKKNTLREWADEGIALRKGGWGRIYIYQKGKRVKALPKEIDYQKVDLDQIKKLIATKN